MKKQVLSNPFDSLPEILTRDLERNLCVCNEVSRRKVIQAIANGARTLDEVRQLTYASDGNGCCRRQVERLIAALWS